MADRSSNTTAFDRHFRTKGGLLVRVWSPRGDTSNAVVLAALADVRMQLLEQPAGGKAVTTVTDPELAQPARVGQTTNTLLVVPGGN